MAAKQQTSKEYFKTLYLVFYSLLYGQVMFALVSVFVNYKNNEPITRNKPEIFYFLVFLMITGIFLISNILLRNRLTVIKKENDLIRKMTSYRSALIIRYALYEGASLLAFTFYLVTNDLFFLVPGSLVVLFLIVIRPARDRAINELELNASDAYRVNDRNAVIAEITEK